ncbi:hypothetical protein VTO42DRAFT_7869 [Malbranchea cinnamomea]
MDGVCLCRLAAGAGSIASTRQSDSISIISGSSSRSSAASRSMRRCTSSCGGASPWRGAWDRHRTAACRSSAR